MIQTESKNVSRPLSSPVAEVLLITVCFGVLIACLYGNMLMAWWGWDDPSFLRLAYEYEPWEYFFIPEIWRKCQPANLNPWNILSFDLDLTLFSLNQSAFYMHHLLSLWFVAIGTYLFLRLWLNPLWSAMGAVLFISSAPVATVAHQLMNRHYLEGLLFSIAALYLYVSAVRHERLLLTWVGGLLYFFAVSAKEVFVPLPLILLLIPERDLRRRLISALPFLLVLGVYAFWRRYMLGRWVGGYSPSLDWAAMSAMGFKIPSFIFGDGPFGVVTLLMIIALMFYAVWRNPSARALIILAILLLLGTILPVIHISDPQRLLFLFVWALSIAVVLTVGTMARSSPCRVITGLLMVVMIWLSMAGQGWKIRAGLENAADGYAAHGRFIMESGEKEVLLPSIRYGNWFAAGLLWLRKNMLAEPTPFVVFDEIDLPAPDGGSLRFFRYDETRRYIQDVTGQTPGIYTVWKNRLRKTPLSVKLDYTGGMLSWRLGPHKEGDYSVITYGDSGYKLGIPFTGTRRVEISEPMLFRIRYDASEGWTSYSPLMHFDGKKLRVKQAGQE